MLEYTLDCLGETFQCLLYVLMVFSLTYVNMHTCVYESWCESWWWKRVYKLKGCSDEIFFLFLLKTIHIDSNAQGVC